MLDQVLDAFAISLVGGVGPDARSGAGVHRVRTADGQGAYLKITPAELGDGPRTFARRELAFYRAGTPVRTPGLINSLDAEPGVALLLADAGGTVPLGAWTDELRRAVVEQVVAVQTIEPPFRGETSALDSAMATPDLAAIEPFWGGVLPDLDAILADRASWLAALRSGPRGFVHGDLHASNVLRDDRGRVGLIDWQFCGIGPQLADWAFPRVRASTDGLSAQADLLPTARALGVELPADAEAQVDRIELAYYVYVWTPYARYNDAAAIARVQARARRLARS